MSSRPAPDAALVAANEHLYRLREKHQKTKASRLVSEPSLDLNGSQERPFLPQKIAQLPDHLGWESDLASHVIRASQGQAQHTAPFLQEDDSTTAVFPQKPADIPQFTAQLPRREALSLDLGQSVKVYPDIALAMLREEQAAAGRLWLILRHLDVVGCGVLRVVNLRKTLTTPKNKQRLCGWRQLRNLLQQGEGIYWQRDKERVWLRSAGRVAGALGVSKLNGRPVAIPVKHLWGSVGEARAYLYASFHAGRQLAPDNVKQKPIARDTLTALSGVSAESQRGYERRVGIRVQSNYAVGANSNAVNQEEQIWQRDGAAFEFVDHQGRQGKPGQKYLVWQLPNSYYVNLPHRPRGRQKRINRTLTDLFMQGMTGNGQQVLEKRYFGEVAQAVKFLHKQAKSHTEAYWSQKKNANGRLHMWYPVKG